MKLWTSVTSVPNDRNHYVVVGIEDEYLADMLKLAKLPLPGLIVGTTYSLPSGLVSANLYARTAATDAVLGQLFMNDGEDEDLEVVLDDAPYDSGSQLVGYESFESLHNALALAGSKANPDWCYEVYLTRLELTCDGLVDIPVTIVVTEEGMERVSYLSININPIEP